LGLFLGCAPVMGFGLELKRSWALVLNHVKQAQNAAFCCIFLHFRPV